MLCGNGSAGAWWVTRLADELEHLTSAHGNGHQEGEAVVPGTPAGPQWGTRTPGPQHTGEMHAGSYLRNRATASGLGERRLPGLVPSRLCTKKQCSQAPASG